MQVLTLQGLDAPSAPAARPNGGSSSISIVCCNGG
jgi:hypothetical protein